MQTAVAVVLPHVHRVGPEIVFCVTVDQRTVALAKTVLYRMGVAA
jgi:hypothetical protein